MERIYYLLKQSLFVKLALVATLVIGGGNSVWGDTVIFDENGIAEGWSTGNIASSSNKMTPPGGTTQVTSTLAFTFNNTNHCLECLYSSGGYSNYSWYAIYSNNKVSISSAEKIIIYAKGQGSSSAQLFLNYSTEKTPNSNYITADNFTTELQSVGVQPDFTKFEISNIPTGEYYFQLIVKAVTIQSIYIQSASIPVLSVTPNEDAAFGSVAGDSFKSYVVSNVGAGAMDVSITNSNTNDFTISKTSITGLTAGNSETFMVTFNYDADNLGEKNAIITITPSYDESSAITLNVSATAMSDNDPKISVTPSEPADFGFLCAVDTKIYTITNTGTGNLTVNISSDNEEYFSVSPTNIVNIAGGTSETFTITFNWVADINKFGEKSANITVTPTYDESAAITIPATATATAELVLDENSETDFSSGYKSSILIKYTPVRGWNTISMPIAYSNYWTEIFGSSSKKTFKLKSYEGGVLTFESSSYISRGNPALVYIENPTVQEKGVLLTGNVYADANATKASNVAEATFQGTWVRKDYVDGDNWYGVTSSGQVLQAGEGAYVKGYRAYFTGISAPTDGSRISIVLEGDGTTTDMGFVKMVDKDATDVYTLSGQKVQKAGKGLYIVNGRKVVIK